jgi:autophagy-related protein 9
MSSTAILGDKKTDLVERAHEYDRALLQSQNAAAARKRHQAGTVLAGGSTASQGAVGTGANSSMFQSGLAGIATAQTAVLGDSQGSIAPPPEDENMGIADEDLEPDGGVGCELGESYVDGNAKRARVYGQEEEGDEELEDGGVLGLLAQIYGAKGQGPARVI